MPEITLDRSAIRFPALHDDPAIATSLPAPLHQAHQAALNCARYAIAKCEAIKNDPTLSESERTNRMRALHDATMPVLDGAGAVAGQMMTKADSSANASVHAEIARHDPARMLEIAKAVAGRPREGKVSAALRAKTDSETASAIVNAPAEMLVLDGVDPRVTDGLRDSLIDPAVRASSDAAKFAAARLRAGVDHARQVIRQATHVEQPMAERMVRVA